MLSRLFGEDLFDEVFEDPFEMMPVFSHHNPLYGKHAKALMKTDVREKDNAYELDIDLPGFKKEEIQAQISNGYLTISASKGLDKEQKDNDGRYIRRERYSGACSRSFYVGEDVTEKDISAKFEDGILKLTVPKKEAKALPEPNRISIELSNVLRQCINLISVFPMLSVYGYQAHRHYNQGKSLYIHNPEKHLSTAENILLMLRPDKKYTPFEATILDLALVLHMEHGGGNNSTFTTHVVSSSGTDTYSTIAAALGSLKGPKHGGANIKVVSMFHDMKRHIKDPNDEDEIRAYLVKLLHKEAFDKRGLIYGMGHAVYSISDPRAQIFKKFVKQLAEEKGRKKDYELYAKIERLAPEVIAQERRIYKGVSANVDFYSGFVYSMLGLPLELYTPMFAIARIVGWSAHRMEELINTDKIIRPAYKNVLEEQPYVSLEER